jgi:SWIM zinc finger
MSSSSIEHAYHYPFASTLENQRWVMAASSGPSIDEHTFFDGRLTRPDVTARLLLVLSQIVRTHFFDARPPQMDPIATSSPSMVRFEGFSGCCGVYARVDLDQRAFAEASQTFGTTNVDFNPPMIAHLARISRSDDTSLAITRDSVSIETESMKTVEKRVALPKRWVKGLSEVQAYQTRLARYHSFRPAAIAPLLQSVAKCGSGLQHLVVQGSSIRLSQRTQPGAMPIGGAARLRVILPLLSIADEVSFWCDADSQTSAVTVETMVGRLWLVLSPGMQRGFSGEGQVLTALAENEWQPLVDDLYDLLGWQSQLDPAELAVRLGCRAEKARDALFALSTRGLAGFDAHSGYYFHRELPLDVDAIEKDQPRLRAARKLFDSGAVRILRRDGDQYDVEVPGSGVNQFVRLRPDGDRCSCIWFSRHQDQRGPCKHVLAARLRVEDP